MRGFLQKFILSIPIFFFLSNNLFAQSSLQSSLQSTFQLEKFDKLNFHSYRDSVDTVPEDTNFVLPRGGTNPTIPVALGVVGFFYLLNPIILFENDKIALGITKEISVGFGYFGENRIAFEYSFIFRDDHTSHFRLGYKRDFIMSDILPSNFLQSTGVLTLGASAFTDLDGYGVSPEVAYGFSFRNDKLLIYPHVKGRFTYTFDKPRSNIIDFSFGLIIGFANPFTDLKIRRYW
jgi:hypothetical protein